MQKNDYSRNQACIELKGLISNWLSEKQNRNISTFAREAGVSENCIRRILNNNSIPVAENLFKIIVFLNGNKKNSLLISSLPTDLKNLITFELSFLNFEEMSDYSVFTDLEKVLIDFPHQIIFERSSMGKGIDKTEVIDMFGSYGETIINNLQKYNLIQVTDEKIVCIENYKHHSLSTSYYKNLSAQFIQNHYKLESSINYLFFQNESVSINGYAKLMDVLEDASKKAMAVIKENPGEVPVALVNCLDTLSKKDYFTKKMDGEQC